jgi:hypothetical protein
VARTRGVTLRDAAVVGAVVGVLGTVLGRLWVGIFLAVAYVVVSVLVRREERGLLEDLKALPPDEQEEVLSHDPELANELRPKLRSDSVPPN